MSLPLSAETGCQRNSEDIQILLMTKLCAATNYLRYVAVKTCDLFDCRFDLMCMVWPLKSERWGRSGLIFECLPAVTLLSRHPGIKFSLIYSQESPVIKRLTTALWRRRRRTRARHFNCQLNRTLPHRGGKTKTFSSKSTHSDAKEPWNETKITITVLDVVNYNSAQLMLNCSQMLLFILIRLQQRLEFENGHQGKNLFVLWGGGEALTGLGADPFVFVSVFVFFHLHF